MNVEDIVGSIEEDIVFGVHPPQARLIEERLAERFDVKRHTVREAFARLEDLGLVLRVPNRGAVVAELTPGEVRSIYDMREMLEVAAVRRMRLPAPQDILLRMIAIQERHSAAVSDEDFRAVFRENIEFHRAQYSACRNPYLIATIEEYARKAHLIRAIKYGDRSHMAKVVEHHWAIIEAMKRGDGERLEQLVIEHLPGSPEEYIRFYEVRHGKQPAA